MREAAELSTPTSDYYAAPLEVQGGHLNMTVLYSTNVYWIIHMYVAKAYISSVQHAYVLGGNVHDHCQGYRMLSSTYGW